MLQYPSIIGVKKSPIGNPCIAFYKHDGSNLRFEWSPKKGFHKFGSRTQMIDSKTPILGLGVELFMDTIADELIEILKWKYASKFKSIQRITAFAEFLGENSFAGSHEESDEKFLKLFDVFMFQKGFIEPKQFVEYFSNKDWATQAVYNGNLNHDFIEKVRTNTLAGFDLNEGVICKWSDKSGVCMTKIKTLNYLEKLKKKFTNWEQFVDNAV
jgi:hypothetical protein